MTGAALALALALLLALAPLAEAGSFMKRSEVRIARPTDVKTHPLEGLFMGSHQAQSVTEITAIRLKSLPDESADPLKVVWVVTMSNTRSITQVLNLKIVLRDEQGKRLASGRGRLTIATSTLDKEYEIKLKVKAAAWQASTKLDLQADWIG